MSEHFHISRSQKVILNIITKFCPFQGQGNRYEEVFALLHSPKSPSLEDVFFYTRILPLQCVTTTI